MVGGALNGAIKRAIDNASGGYAIRRKDSHGVVYVGESDLGRMWRTMLRHFQTDNFRTDLPRFNRAEDYEIAWKVTSRGKRSKTEGGDQRAMQVQADWIAAWRASGAYLKNEDDGLADVAMMRCPECHGSGETFVGDACPICGGTGRVQKDNPRALVSASKVKILASGELDTREHGALFLSLLAATDRASDKEARETGDRAAANLRNEEARAVIRSANAAGELARSARYEREINALRDRARDARPAPDSYEHELAVMRGKRANPAPRARAARPAAAPAGPRGVLVELGLLTRLTVGPEVLAWSLRGAPVLAYDADRRLVLVYAVGRIERASSPPEVKEYARTHWGKQGRGDVRGGGLAPPPFVDLGPAVAITYTTAKGADRALVDYVHPFGEGSSRRCIFPRVLEHRCAGGCRASCAARGTIALAGGSYVVEDRGIVG